MLYYASLALLALVGSAAGCTDTAGFVDEQEYSCHNWDGAGCWSATSVWGYSPKGQSDVLANCRASCGACSDESAALAKAASEKKAVAMYSEIRAAAFKSVAEQRVAEQSVAAQGGRSTTSDVCITTWCYRANVVIGPACFETEEHLCGGCADLDCYAYDTQADCIEATKDRPKPGSFCHSEFWWQDDGAEEQVGACQNDPTFRDKDNYPCSSWHGLRCDLDVWKGAPYNYNDNQLEEVIQNCPATCLLMEPNKPSFVQEHFGESCTVADIENGSSEKKARTKKQMAKIEKFVAKYGRLPRFGALASPENQKVQEEAVRAALAKVSPPGEATDVAQLERLEAASARVAKLQAELKASLRQLSTDLRAARKHA